MISRPMQDSDLGTLQTALDNNEFHPGQQIGHYFGENRYTEIYEDEQGPIGFLRYTKSLRLVVTWCDGTDRVRNGQSIVAAIEKSVKMAKEGGYTDIIFETHSEKVRAFCEKLGFRASDGETMVKVI